MQEMLLKSSTWHNVMKFQPWKKEINW
jgi:hypothetical protein